MEHRNLKSLFKQIKEKIADVCDSLQERTRAILIIGMGILLGSGSVIAIAQSIYLINKNEQRRRLPKIEHVNHLKIPNNDSINLYNLLENDTGREYPDSE